MKTLVPNALALAAAFGLAIAAGPALAGGSAERNTMEISFADLDLDTPEGQMTLERRIERAARDVCRYDRMQTGTRIQSRAAKECYEKAKASARQQVAAHAAKQRRGV